MKNLDNLIREAHVLIVAAHGEQVDKAGEPYLNHLYRVADLASDKRFEYRNPQFVSTKRLEYLVGLLHDIVEDTDVQTSKIFAQFGPTVYNAVVAITHLPNEPYRDYLDRVKGNKLATAVKLADLRDNADFDRALRLAKVDKKAFKRVVEVLIPRYIRAYNFLTHPEEKNYLTKRRA